MQICYSRGHTVGVQGLFRAVSALDCTLKISHLLARVYQCYGEYWKYNTQTEQWEGNPVFESKYRNYYDSLKNRDNKTETTQQSLPMLPSDLEIIMKYLDSAEGNAKYSKTRRLFFKAFASTAFTLWTR